ncbi:MAG: hypothetical protein U1F66_06455 [bacterium]
MMRKISLGWLLLVAFFLSPLPLRAGDAHIDVTDDADGDKVAVGTVITFDLAIHSPGGDGRSTFQLDGNLEGEAGAALDEEAVTFEDCGECDFRPEGDRFQCFILPPARIATVLHCRIRVKPGREGFLQLAGFGKYFSYRPTWESAELKIAPGGGRYYYPGYFPSAKDKLKIQLPAK